MALKRLWQRTTPLDRLVIGLLAIAVLFSFRLLTGGEPGERLLVERDGRLLFTAPLAADREVSLSGPLGQTVLVIRQGGARIVRSPCPHQDCLAMGPARHHGDLLACVPNRLLVRIEGGGSPPTDYDLLSR
ncbi:MAG: NusG domain II-containing protein [Desulfuromonadales bacterium]|nr:NusG domain II-containing protein [Desulfuromonadales bacterium]